MSVSSAHPYMDGGCSVCLQRSLLSPKESSTSSVDYVRSSAASWNSQVIVGDATNTSLCCRGFLACFGCLRSTYVQC